MEGAKEVNGKTVESIVDAAIENVEMYSKLAREQFQGMAPGMHQLKDADFYAWTLMQMAKEGPDYLRHLEYVEGGKEELRRFIKIQGERNGDTT